MLERHREVEREKLILVVEPIIRQRVEERLVAIGGNMGEVLIVLNDPKLSLGKGRQLLACKFARLFLPGSPLNCERGGRVIEDPMIADAGNAGAGSVDKSGSIPN